MKVIVISKTNFTMYEFSNVTSISFSAGVYTITAGSTHTYAADNYIVHII